MHARFSRGVVSSAVHDRASVVQRSTRGETVSATGIHPLLQFQREHGNRWVQRYLARMLDNSEKERGLIPAQTEEAIAAARGGGKCMEDNVQKPMESSFGADFSQVRVHTDARSDSLCRSVNALAFTTGSDLFFRHGMYDPASRQGRELLAHELTHVVQQSGAPVQRKLALGPADDVCEKEADRVATAVVAEQDVTPVTGVAQPMIRRVESSNPDNFEDQLKQQGLLQTKRAETSVCHPLFRTAATVSRIQRRGGATVGQLSVNTNVIGAGLTAGHAWLAYNPVGGTMTTYGTWGNKPHIGLNRDLELGSRAAASRTTDLDSGDYTSLTTFAAANDAWTLTNNCASFAARGWKSVTAESLSYTTWFIPNPSALGQGIVAANGGTTGVLPAAAAAGGGGGSSKGSSL